MMKVLGALALFFVPFLCGAQELFPLSEPASAMPKHVLGIRAFSETYKEVNQWRNMSAIRAMYGLGPRLSLYATLIGSNHHGKKMPEEFPFHNTPERGAYYPYELNGAHVYAKYRFLSLDGPNRHFRMAGYAEAALVKTTHHETEPDLMMGDNSGWGLGTIATYLHRKWAVSVTLGGIWPAARSSVSPDPVATLPDVPVRTEYGRALLYSLSMGYLLLPRTYSGYEQTNVNLYLELKGKAFETARVTLFEGLQNQYVLDAVQYPPALQKGYFLDLSPGLQFIVRSNLRIDLSSTFPMLGKSYARLYPVFTIGAQYYLFL